jgi:hypothetical protein
VTGEEGPHLAGARLRRLLHHLGAESSADFVRSAGQAIGDAATSLASFFESLA